MRRWISLFIVMVIGLARLALLPAAAQEQQEWQFGKNGEEVRWSGVSRPLPPADPVPAPPGGAQVMQPYSVFFSEDYAAVPVVPDAEFMVIVVKQGSFALDLMPPDLNVKPSDPEAFLVQPIDGPIPILNRVSGEPYYENSNDVVLRDGSPCVSMCVIPVQTAVRIREGDKVVAKEGAICLYCLLNSSVDATDQGLFDVYVLRDAGSNPQDFSWIRNWEDEQKLQSQTSDAPLVRAWAYLNPGSGCKDG
jgi:hypothetical protein